MFLEGWTKMRAMMKTSFWLMVSAILFDVSAALTSDGLALLDFKKGLTGNLSAVQDWKASDSSPCNWTNIVCTKQGYVSIINLEIQSLSGKLSSSLGKLQSLQELRLSFNGLHGSIPRELGNCTALTLLHLRSNLFTGTIPLELGNLTKLTEIDLGLNSLNGQVPQKIFENINLVSIYLDNNNLTGDVTAGLEALSKLPAIAEIWMHCNCFTGSLPPSLGNAINLDSFLINYQYLGNGSGLFGTIPKELGKLVNLTALDLRDNNFTGSIPAELGNLTKLNQLQLSSNHLTGIIPKELGKLQNLAVLDLYQNKLTGGIPSELGNLLNLTDFVIYINNLTGPIPKSLGQLSNLLLFNVHNNSLSGPVPTEIYNCTLLTTFYLSDNQFSGGIAPEIGKLTQLKSLRMGNNNFSGPLPVEIVNCKSLYEMTFYTNGLTGSIPTGVANITTLEQIYFYDNHMSGPLPPQLGMFSNLTYLDIRNNSFNGTLPTGLCNFGGLTFLDILSNEFEGAIPVSLSSCVTLTRFRAAYNRFTSLPDGFGKGGALNLIDLSSNQLQGVLPKNLGSNSNLSNLNLGDNHLSGDLFSLPFAQLANLQLLNLSTNNFTGQVPSGISSCTKLFSLDLSSNSLNGYVPSALGNLTRLEKLYLDDNNFTGMVGSMFVQFNNMLFLDLAHNPFGGSIPSEIGTLSTLENLNLSFGQFSGAIPSELSKLSQLVVLDLSHNNLSGVVPDSLGDIQSLLSVNVSYNNLNGSLPTGWVHFLNTTPSDFAGNPDLCRQYSSQNLCVNTTSVTPAASDGKELKWWAWMAIALCSIGLLLAVGTVLGLWWFYPRNRKKNLSQSSIEIISSPGITISFDEIMEATGNLSDKCIIGKGGHGTVYKAILMSGTPIVVKKIVGLDTNNRVYRSFLTEIETIGSAKHRNLVKLLGFCKWGDIGLLLYDYVSNGDLHNALHNKEAGVVMDWPTRLRIAEGVAHGLNYLHHDYIPSIIHRDIKASNVLLDNDLEAHISDFGIAKVMDMKKDKPVTSSAVVTGTYGYIAPEAGFGTMLSPKVDVYSYGILLLELLTGKQPVDSSFGDPMHIAAWVRGMVKEKSARLGEAVLDPVILLGTNELQKTQMLRVLRTAVLCTKENPNDRPSMTAVVEMLRTSGFLQPQASQQPEVTPR